MRTDSRHDEANSRLYNFVNAHKIPRKLLLSIYSMRTDSRHDEANFRNFVNAHKIPRNLLFSIYSCKM